MSTCWEEFGLVLKQLKYVNSNKMCLAVALKIFFSLHSEADVSAHVLFK